MIVLRALSIFIFSTLMTGCETYINPFGTSGKQLVEDVKSVKARFVGRPNPCLPPGATQKEKCYFVLTITNPDAGGGFVKGHVATKACDQNHNSGNPFEDCTKYPYPDFPFKVKGSPKLTSGADYDFDSEPGSDILVCRDQAGAPTTINCYVRTTSLPTK